MANKIQDIVCQICLGLCVWIHLMKCVIDFCELHIDHFCESECLGHGIYFYLFIVNGYRRRAYVSLFPSCMIDVWPTKSNCQPLV